MKRIMICAAGILLSAAVSFAAETAPDGNSSAFFPKGTKAVGLAVSYNNYNIGSESGYDALLSMIQDVNGGIETWNLSANASYFIKDDLSLGVRVGYKRNDLRLDSGDITFSDMGFNLGNNYYLGHRYTLDLFARAYMPIGRSNVFAFFGEIGLQGGFGQNKTWSMQEDGRKQGTFQEQYSASLFAAPGVIARVTNSLMVTFSVEVFSIDWQNTMQTVNRVDHSNNNSFGLNFNIDLLSTKIGLCLLF